MNNCASIDNRVQFDIEEQFNSIIDNCDHPLDVFNEMSQSFISTLPDHLTPHDIKLEVATFNSNLTEFLRTIEFEIQYS